MSNDELRNQRKKKRKKQQITTMGLIVGLGIIIITGLVGIGFGVREILQKGDANQTVQTNGNNVNKSADKKGDDKEKETTPEQQDEIEKNKRAELIANANKIAAGYDYDKAIEMMKGYENYVEYPELTTAISSYEAAKTTAVKYEAVDTIPHIFFHSLIVDTKRAFDGDDDAAGYNQVMTTADEFNKIMQQMYDKGYVLVSIHDMAVKTTNAEGKEVFTPGEIYLPEGKKPFVLSQDDVCYYEYMEGDGFASKIIIDENGRPTCEYIQEDGTVVTGDYDMVPLLETFIEKHPDFSYRGARGILALTGYNGVFGYRTDPDYASNPTYQQDCEDAKKVAQGLKNAGWEISSHSYGHRSYQTIDMEKFKKDVNKWEETVETIVGETDILIYPFGADICGWKGYEGERYEYLKSVGFNYFCNVDSTQYWVQIKDDYVRQGRRNIDGVRMYYDMIDDSIDQLSDLIDVKSVFDPARPTPVDPM